MILEIEPVVVCLYICTIHNNILEIEAVVVSPSVPYIIMQIENHGILIEPARKNMKKK